MPFRFRLSRLAMVFSLSLLFLPAGTGRAAEPTRTAPPPGELASRALAAGGGWDPFVRAYRAGYRAEFRETLEEPPGRPPHRTKATESFDGRGSWRLERTEKKEDGRRVELTRIGTPRGLWARRTLRAAEGKTLALPWKTVSSDASAPPPYGLMQILRILFGVPRQAFSACGKEWTCRVVAAREGDAPCWRITAEKDRETIEAWYDRETSLPRRYLFSNGGKPTVEYEIESWREVDGGLRFPSRYRTREYGVDGQLLRTTERELLSWTVPSSWPAGFFTPEPAPAAGSASPGR